MSLPDSAISRLIELARWAPSGDNTQPWRFERVASDHLVIHGFDTRDHCVYDLDGHPSQLAIGALIETMHIGATEQSLALSVQRRHDAPDTHPTFDVNLHHQEGLAPDPLLSAIPRRSVNRRAYSPRPLTADEARRLQASLPAGFTLRWYATLGERWRMARLMFANAKLRLTMREAYEVHRSIIDWGQRFSPDKVPDQALGVDFVTLRAMRWLLADWGRVEIANRWLAGTITPRLMMDLIPSMACAGHVALCFDRPLESLDDYVLGGRATQRFWLTATTLGLQHQPELTPLIFSRYVREGLPFSRDPAATALGQKLAHWTSSVFGDEVARIAWLGRIGAGQPAKSRSLRMEGALMTTDATEKHPHTLAERA